MTMGMKKQTFIFFTTTYRSGEIITIRMSSRTYHKGKSKGKPFPSHAQYPDKTLGRVTSSKETLGNKPCKAGILTNIKIRRHKVFHKTYGINKDQNRFFIFVRYSFSLKVPSLKISGDNEKNWNGYTWNNVGEQIDDGLVPRRIRYRERLSRDRNITL